MEYKAYLKRASDLASKMPLWTRGELYRYAKIIHVVTDMGNGGAMCSICNTPLTPDVDWNYPSECPKCGLPLVFTTEGLY